MFMAGTDAHIYSQGLRDVKMLIGKVQEDTDYGGRRARRGLQRPRM